MNRWITPINFDSCLEADSSILLINDLVLLIQSSDRADLSTKLRPDPVSTTTSNGDWSFILFPHVMRVVALVEQIYRIFGI